MKAARESPAMKYLEGLEPGVQEKILAEANAIYKEDGRVDWITFNQIVNCYQPSKLVRSLVFESLRDKLVLSLEGGWGVY